MNKKADIKEFDALLDLLRIEKEKDLEEYKKKIQRLSLQERSQSGVAWYPLQVVKQGYTLGSRAYVVVERTKQLGEEHRFRSGKPVRLFTMQTVDGKNEQTGVIYYVKKDRMQIILNSKDSPDWLTKGLLGVDLLFDDRTYQVMEQSLKQVKKASRDRLAELRDIFLGRQAPSQQTQHQPIELPQLNASQNKAVNAILAANEVSIVHGPPGTGKTTTIVQAVRQLTKTESTVLVTAPSNTAVDLITERLAMEGLVVVRIGNISRVDDNVINNTLELRMSQHPESKNIKKLKVQAADMRRQARRYKRKFGQEEYQNRRAKFQEARELMDWANQLETRILEQILDSAQIITCTLIGAADKVLQNRKFRTVVIDEAAQALEPATWVPITKASRVVLTGDPYQLPPTVKAREAARKGLEITLIEKSLQRLPEVHLLDTQYRMHETIMGFSNQRFYQNRLRAADSVAKAQLPIKDQSPLIFIDTAGCGFEEKVHAAYKSRYNPEEFQILCEHLHQLVDSYAGIDLPEIALISPYREQTLHMEQIIDEDPKFREQPITINTIDGFQGQEKEVVYLSLVRSNPKGEIGFLKDYRRMNVAMTRAKKQLIIVGDSATIGGDDFYADLLAFCESKGSYRSAWDYMR
ncbi:MAG TPA: AAA domain-containing protein [Saprospiraceae bacterium]|nr:AAA domain-containing protein [Saprospiraceae bacterium]